MLLAEWVRSQPRGVYTRMSRKTEISYSHLRELVRTGDAVGRYDTAKRISEFTGGEVSIEELCEPQKFAKKGRRK